MHGACVGRFFKFQKSQKRLQLMNRRGWGGIYASRRIDAVSLTVYAVYGVVSSHRLRLRLTNGFCFDGAGDANVERIGVESAETPNGVCD